MLHQIAIVQDPYEAQYSSMPRSALEYVEADYRLPSTEIGGLLAQLAYEQPTQEMMVEEHTESGLESRIAKEVQIAAGTNISEKGILELGELSRFACPECHGVLVRILDGPFVRYRCHTGHGYTEDALLEHVMEAAGESIWQTARGFQETEMLLKHMAQHIQGSGNLNQAEKFLAKAREIQKIAVYFQEMARSHESLSSDKVKQQQPNDQE